MNELLARLTAVAAHESLAPIPFPEETAPKPAKYHAKPDTPLPKTDVLVVCWTTAEAMATADVLTPGVHRTDWIPYAENWANYEKQLTGRSPAHEEKCMAHYQPSTIGDRRVLVAKSELHLATDGQSLPICQLWKQMIQECEPSLIISTGTAGGIGADTVLGDVLVTNTGRFDCTARFKDSPFAKQSFEGPLNPSHLSLDGWQPLVAVNADRLKPEASRSPRMYTGEDVLTCDAFLFDDAENSFGLRTYDGTARVEEMDDMTLPLALEDLKSSIPWLSIRNASDPQMPNMGSVKAEKTAASKIYLKYGYYTTVCSALACWKVITALK